MKTYEQYKDSGVEWVFDIPISWDVVRLKYLGYTYGGLSGKKGDDFRQEDHQDNRSFIPFTNVSNNFTIDTTDLRSVVIGEDESQSTVEAGDLFLLMGSESQEDVGKSSVLTDDIGEVYLNSFCRGF